MGVSGLDKRAPAQVHHLISENAKKRIFCCVHTATKEKVAAWVWERAALTDSDLHEARSRKKWCFI